MGNKKKQEVENKRAENSETENSGLEEKAGEEETETREEEPIEGDEVKEETSQEFQGIDLEKSRIPSEVMEYTVQNKFPALVDGVFNSLVTNAYLDNFLSKEGLTVQVLENKFPQSSRSSILHVLNTLELLNIVVEGKADEYGKRYYKLQTDFTTWKPSKREGREV